MSACGRAAWWIRESYRLASVACLFSGAARAPAERARTARDLYCILAVIVVWWEMILCVVGKMYE
jgi:hypothetical protein